MDYSETYSDIYHTDKNTWIFVDGVFIVVVVLSTVSAKFLSLTVIVILVKTNLFSSMPLFVIVSVDDKNTAK